MSTTSLLPMRVAVQNRHRKQAGHRFRIEMRAGDGTSRVFLNGPAFPLIDNLPAIPSAVSHALTPLGGGNWRSVIERTLNPFTLTDRLFSRGQRLICKFRGGIIQALRSLLLRYPLIPLRQEPTSGRFQRLFFSPAFLSAPMIHDDQCAAKGLLNDGNQRARPGNPTARSRKHAC